MKSRFLSSTSPASFWELLKALKEFFTQSNENFDVELLKTGTKLNKITTRDA